MAKNKNRKSTIPFYKNWWFWLIVVVVVVSLAMPTSNTKSEPSPVDEEASKLENDEKQSEEATDSINMDDSIDDAPSPSDIEHVELNSLQEFFISLNKSITREDVDRFVEENALSCYRFPSNSCYYIGYDSSAVSQRERDRKGESIDIYFTNSGSVESAEYTHHPNVALSVEYSYGTFHYNKEKYSDGNEAIQRFLYDFNQN